MSKTSKEAEAPDNIFQYLMKQNRPYSTVDIFNNLHKEFGKTCVQRSLDELVTEGKLKEKVYGKQKVYVASQSLFPAVDDAELKAMDKKISELQQTLKERQTECHSLESKVSSLNSSLTLEAATEKLKALDKECLEMEGRLEQIKSGSESVTPEESARIHSTHKDTLRQWRKRKRMATDIINSILEGYPNPKKQLYEEVGIETDEDHGVKLPS